MKLFSFFPYRRDEAFLTPGSCGLRPLAGAQRCRYAEQNILAVLDGLKAKLLADVEESNAVPQMNGKRQQQAKDHFHGIESHKPGRNPRLSPQCGYIRQNYPCIIGRNLYPYTSTPLLWPSSRSFRVTISTGMPISTGRSPRSVSCAVTTGPSSSLTSATV